MSAIFRSPEFPSAARQGWATLSIAVFDLRPIMFTPDEIDAAVLGLRMVKAFAGPDFAPHVRSALAKIALALPAERREEVESTRLFAPAFPDKVVADGISPL